MQTVTPQMEIEARRRDQRTEQRTVDRRFARLEHDMNALERRIRATPSDKRRERERMASQLITHRTEHDRMVRQTRFAIRVEQELTAAIENKQIVRSAVALSRIAQRQAGQLTPERAKKIVERYEEARKQQLDTYSLFDNMFDSDDRGAESESNRSGGGGTPQKTSMAVQNVLAEFETEKPNDEESALERRHALIRAPKPSTDSIDTSVGVREVETERVAIAESSDGKFAAVSRSTTTQEDVPRPTPVAGSIEELQPTQQGVADELHARLKNLTASTNQNESS